MSKFLFLQIVMDIKGHDSCFKQKPDATSKMDIISIQKCKAPIKILAYSFALDACDEYVKLGDNPTILPMEQFVKAILEL